MSAETWKTLHKFSTLLEAQTAPSGFETQSLCLRLSGLLGRDRCTAGKKAFATATAKKVALSNE